MKLLPSPKSIIASVGLVFSIVACNNVTEERTSPEVKKDSSEKVATPKTAVNRPPIINITDTLSVKRTVISIKDSAATFDRIAPKLGDIYMIRLGGFIKKNGLKITGQPIAWYKTNKPPYFFEGGIPVDKKPGKLSPKVFVREIGVDSVIVAHFYGPYEMLPVGYEAVKEYMKDNHKKLNGTPYEIYIGDAIDKNGNKIDPYKVQTDIVFPWK